MLFEDVELFPRQPRKIDNCFSLAYNSERCYFFFVKVIAHEQKEQTVQSITDRKRKHLFIGQTFGIKNKHSEANNLDSNK